MKRMVRLAWCVLVGLLAMSLSGCMVVEDGTVGVSKSFGNISKETLTPGVYANVPLIREVELWNTKTQRRSVRVEIPSSEGLMVSIETTVLFRPLNVYQIRTEIGSEYVRKVLIAELINVFRKVIGKKRVEELIKSQEELTDAANALLKEKMKGRGIVVEDLLVTGLGLPDKFRNAVELKLESEQKALQKEFELKQAKKDAEIEVARARGAAQAQEIVRSTLSQEYLQYLWISTLNQNPNVIYVATEANMPVFRTTQGSKAPAVSSAPAMKAAK